MTIRNRRAVTLLSGCALALASVGWGGVAQAQEPQRGESVFERARPDYDPLGVRAGGFIILPRVEVGQAYNDNIFAVDDDEEDDFITVVSPQVDIESDWNNHELNFSTGAESGFYWDNDDENYLDWFALVDGRLDVMRETNLFGGLGWRRIHEDRGSPDDVDGEEPTEIDRSSANLGAFRGLGRISTRVNALVDRLDYHDVDAAGGGQIDQDDRDRTQYELRGRVGYEYLTDTNAFIELRGRMREYDELEGGFDRDSQGFAVLVGTDLNFTGKVTGEVFAGYQSTSYDDDELDSISSPAAGGSVLWNVTDLTSIRGFVEGSIEETTQADASGYQALRAGGSVEHELRRNILLGAAVTVGRDDYEGIDREDDLFTGAVSARYLINRNFYAGAELSHRTRNSDTDDEFSQNVILLRFGAQL